MCVGGERMWEKKGTEGRENPSEIKRHVPQQRKSGRFMDRDFLITKLVSFRFIAA